MYEKHCLVAAGSSNGPGLVRSLELIAAMDAETSYGLAREVLQLVAAMADFDVKFVASVSLNVTM